MTKSKLPKKNRKKFKRFDAYQGEALKKKSKKDLPPRNNDGQMTRREREIAEAMQMVKKGVQKLKRKNKSKKAFSCAEIPRKPYEADKDYVRRVEMETRIRVQQDLQRIRVELDAEKQQQAEEDNKAKRLKRQRRKEQKKAEERKRRRLEKEAETEIEEVPEKTTHTETKQKPNQMNTIQRSKEHKKKRRRNVADVVRIERVPFGERVDAPPVFSESVRKRFGHNAANKAGARDLVLKELLQAKQ